jgi:hypothetical protein
MIKNKKSLTAEEMPEFHSGIDPMPEDRKKFIDELMEEADNKFRQEEKEEAKQTRNKKEA